MTDRTEPDERQLRIVRARLEADALLAAIHPHNLEAAVDEVLRLQPSADAIVMLAYRFLELQQEQTRRQNKDNATKERGGLPSRLRASGCSSYEALWESQQEKADREAWYSVRRGREPTKEECEASGIITVAHSKKVIEAAFRKLKKEKPEAP
jgi:hypothetical protein